MRLDLFMQRSSNIKGENRLLRFFVAVIGAAVIVNSFFVYTSVKHQRTVLVPAGLNSRVEVSDGNASDDYLKFITRYAAGLALNYTPATARQQFGELLSLYSPDAFPEAKKAFYGLADTVETAGVTNSFFIISIRVDRKKGVIDMTGLKRQSAQDSKVIDDVQTTYELGYGISDGRFMLTYFKEKERR
jgi:conjugal transfer pilus assembly protein TraE